jgi:rubredoxin
MKFCEPHWERLKELIKEAGLYGFVAKGGENLVERLEKEKRGEFVIPDPLLTCHNNLIVLAIQQGGPYLMGKDEEGKDYCPMCECKIGGQKNGFEDLDEQWLTTEVGRAKDYFKLHGLLQDN